MGTGTLPETNIDIALENRPGPNRKVVFQPSIFRCYVSFREGSLQILTLHVLPLFFVWGEGVKYPQSWKTEQKCLGALAH